MGMPAEEHARSVLTVITTRAHQLPCQLVAHRLQRQCFLDIGRCRLLPAPLPPSSGSSALMCFAGKLDNGQLTAVQCLPHQAAHSSASCLLWNHASAAGTSQRRMALCHVSAGLCRTRVVCSWPTSALQCLGLPVQGLPGLPSAQSSRNECNLDLAPASRPVRSACLLPAGGVEPRQRSLCCCWFCNRCAALRCTPGGAARFCERTGRARLAQGCFHHPAGRACSGVWVGVHRGGRGSSAPGSPRGACAHSAAAWAVTPRCRTRCVQINGAPGSPPLLRATVKLFRNDDTGATLSTGPTVRWVACRQAGQAVACDGTCSYACSNAGEEHAYHLPCAVTVPLNWAPRSGLSCHAVRQGACGGCFPGQAHQRAAPLPRHRGGAGGGGEPEQT